MALPPKFAGQKLIPGGKPVKAINTVELYLDYVCPFSAKMFKTLYSHVLPAAKSKPYANSVQFIFRQQIQPWHPSSTLVHESGAAVLRLAPDKFWEYSAALFEKSSEYYDVSVVSEERNHTYERLAKLAGSVGVDPGKVEELLWVEHEAGEDGALNVGNKVTDDVKLMVKMNRMTGVHVTPTVVFNGIVENSISSSFTAAQWDEWLQKNCT